MRKRFASSINVPVLMLAVLLAACGGGGGGSSGGGGGGSSLEYGYFIDAAVEGAIVESASGNIQRTDENGVFSFRLGERLTFRIDDVELGWVNQGAEVVTPGRFDSLTGLQVFRFIQSMDVSPGTPGIDVTGIDLPPTPINFSQSNSFFENDPAVIAALAASTAAGATGVLIDYDIARDNFLADSNRIIARADFEDLVVYPVSVPGPNEPCLVFFNADLSGESICRDDIQADPANAAETFTWDEVGGEIEAENLPDTITTVTKNGTTGNRIHARVLTECVTCDPNAGPTFEFELQNFYTAIPIVAGDFSGQTLTLSTGTGTTTAIFDGGGTVILNDGSGPETANWSVDLDKNMLLLQGTGLPASVDLPYVRAILIDGSVSSGQFAVLTALVDDSNGNGIADTIEFDLNGVYESIELQTSN